MKSVIIYQENSEPIQLFDEDTSVLENFIEQLYQLFNSPNVCKITSNDKTILIRPSKIISIEISEEVNNKQPKTTTRKKQYTKVNANEEGDIVTDA